MQEDLKKWIKYGVMGAVGFLGMVFLTNLSFRLIAEASDFGVAAGFILMIWYGPWFSSDYGKDMTC